MVWTEAVVAAVLVLRARCGFVHFTLAPNRGWLPCYGAVVFGLVEPQLNRHSSQANLFVMKSHRLCFFEVSIHIFMYSLLRKTKWI